MIKFNCLIHKQTRTIIKYVEWLEEVKKQQGITNQPVEKQISEKEKLIYRPKQALFSDDFEIIYDSEFTMEELIEISEDREGILTEAKINKLIEQKEYIKNKYGIEV